VFTGVFFGRIETEDTLASPHVLSLRLRLRDDRLAGSVAAAAMKGTFVLPHWMDLKKEK
jgi:hypothetical protein